MMPALVHVLWVAAPWYVDGDAQCPGDGSDAAPFCTLQGAFANEALAAGDEILLRTSELPYDGASIGGTDAPPSVSGTADEPIVLQPDAGHSPVLAGRVALYGCSHWTLRGLVFHGEGDAAPVSAIDVYADEISGEVHGVVVEGNTILGFGGAAELDEGAYTGRGVVSLASWTEAGTPMLIGPVVRDNRIRSSRGAGISVRSAAAPLVEGNEIADLDCQLDISYLDGDGTTWVTRAAVIGIRVDTSADARISRNRVLDLDAAGCAPFDVDYDAVYGIWIDEADAAEIDRNFVHGIGQQPGYGFGVDITGGSHDARVHHNIFVDADRCGVCDGVDSSGGGDRARIVNNTIVGGREHGIDVMQGEDTEIRNNLVSGTDDAAIRILGVEGWVMAWTADDNLYWGEGAEIGQIGWSTATDLATWQRDCGCDASSTVADPILPGSAAPEDFTVATTSPAIDAGAELVENEGYNGAAPDVGALEAPLPISAVVHADAPTRVQLAVEHSGAGTLGVDPSCLGLSVNVDDVPVALVGCEVVDATTIVVQLAEPVHAGQAVALVHTGGTITDDARIGGVIDAFMGPFDLVVDNEAEGTAPMDSGSSSGDADGGTTGAADETTTVPAQDDGSFPDAAACECRSDGTSDRAPLVLLALALRPRRRRR